MEPNKSNIGSFLFNRSVQGVFYQLITVGLVALGIYYIVTNTARNMLERGLASGFHFLGVESQFDIGMTLIEYSPTSTYFDSFIVGLLNTCCRNRNSFCNYYWLYCWNCKTLI